jgi:hypothetical protein
MDTCTHTDHTIQSNANNHHGRWLRRMNWVASIANNHSGRWPRRTPSCLTRATLATLQHIDTDGYIYTTPSAYFITAISWPNRYDLHWQTRRESASWGECSEVGRIDRRTCLPDAGDLVGERGSDGGLTDCTECYVYSTAVLLYRSAKRGCVRWIRSALSLQYGATTDRRIYGARRIRTRMLRVGRRAMGDDRRLRILLLLDREAAPLAERPAGDEHQHRQHRGSPGTAPGSHK